PVEEPSTLTVTPISGSLSVADVTTPVTVFADNVAEPKNDMSGKANSIAVNIILHNQACWL
ncbi:MAG: hypothetical protein MR670_13545, partial [Prevotella sp.]|nr:hypothetical protein [Prevotella sp.]